MGNQIFGIICIIVGVFKAEPGRVAELGPGHVQASFQPELTNAHFLKSEYDVVELVSWSPPEYEGPQYSLPTRIFS